MPERPADSFQGAQLTNALGVSQPLLKAAVESANDAIIITEARLEEPGPLIEYVNPAFARMTGWGVDEIIGKNPRVLQGPKTDRGLLRRLRDDLANRRSFHGETINYRKDGTEYTVEWRITPLFDEAGEVVKWVAIQRDVTDRVREQAEREHLLEREKHARAEAERESRLKDEFLATLSHELRTPLNAIVGWTHLLMRDGAVQDDGVREGLGVISRNAGAQTQLIEDLLDMSRVITGRLRLEVQRVDMPTVIEAAVAAVRPAADAKGVRLHQIVDNTTAPVAGDPVRLQQVVWNLLTNAVKFTPAGGRVQLVLERVNSHVELSVSDSGLGIKPEFLPHVFDRFRQEDASTTRRQGGLGLGLAIVKHLVELHGGHVRAKSPGEGHGSTFVVALPVSVAHQPDPSAPPVPSGLDGEEGDCPPDLTGVDVLVVDDDVDSRGLMQRILSDCGMKVVAAASAAEALEHFARHRPRLLVSDIGMPGMDGYKLMQTIRAKSRSEGGQIPAVAVTAFARSEDRRRALIAGFDTHVSKPIEPAELLAVLARLATRSE